MQLCKSEQARLHRSQDRKSRQTIRPGNVFRFTLPRPNRRIREELTIYPPAVPPKATYSVHESTVCTTGMAYASPLIGGTGFLILHFQFIHHLLYIGYPCRQMLH